MSEIEQNMHNPLSLNDLENVAGGALCDQDAVIKQQLDDAAARNDIDAFIAIIKNSSRAGDREFLHNIVAEYTRSSFLTSSICALLYAEVLHII